MFFKHLTKHKLYKKPICLEDFSTDILSLQI